MSRINTNVTSLIAQRVMTTNSKNLSSSLQRLSTGLKINSGADDPAGLIASENLRSEQAGITQAIDNAGRASNIIGTAEGGLSEVSNLLTQLQGLVGQAANSGGMSSDEVAANQLQVDSILNTINRISGSTAFEGKKLLNGDLGYTTSGVNASAFTDVQINAAKLAGGTARNVIVNVTDSATLANVTHTSAAATTGVVTLEVAGNKGTEQLAFASGTVNADVLAAVNAVKDATGVSATASGAVLKFNSTQYGSDQFASVKVTGTYTTSATKALGTDAVVTVNGAAATANGLNVTYRSSNLDVELTMSTDLNAGASANFYVTGGGANFALGSKVSEANKASIGIASISTQSLGDTTNSLASLATGGANQLSSANLVTAQDTIDKAIKQVSSIRGRLGAFQKFTIGSTVNSLGVAYENAAAAQSAIRDTDFAQETANLTRSQILQQASATVLAQANASPQIALSLLRGA